MTDFVNEFKQQKEYKDFSVILHASTGRQKPIMVCGLCEGAELAFLESLLTESDGKKGALFLAPDEKKVRRLTDALTADGYRVLPYLYREPVLHNITGSHDFEYEHLRVLASLLDGKFDAVLATPDAAMQYTIPPARLRDASFSLTADCGITRETLLQRLEEAGYYRCELVDGPGQYSARGGIVDLYSPAEGEPLRADFFGDELDRICYFDVMSQRQSEVCTGSYTVSPCREVLLNESGRAEVRKAVAGCVKNAKDERVREELEGELSVLDAGGELSCADKYISLIYPEKTCLLDYLPGVQPVALEYAAVIGRQKSRIPIPP